MQIFGMLIFLAVWLLVLWIGSMALEATGMERSVARFQALSALSGVGFTTSRSESIVEHPRRRRVVSYLIFLGNTGIIALLLLVIVYARAGIAPPSTPNIAITVGVLVVIGLAIWLGLVDRISNALLKLTRKERAYKGIAQKILLQAGDYAVVKLTIGGDARIAGLSVKETGLQQRNITLLAIERGDTILSQPQLEEKLLPGDSLLCYGKVTSTTDLTEKRK